MPTTACTLHSLTGTSLFSLGLCSLTLPLCSFSRFWVPLTALGFWVTPTLCCYLSSWRMHCTAFLSHLLTLCVFSLSFYCLPASPGRLTHSAASHWNFLSLCLLHYTPHMCTLTPGRTSPASGCTHTHYSGSSLPVGCTPAVPLPLHSAPGFQSGGFCLLPHSHCLTTAAATHLHASLGQVPLWTLSRFHALI